MFEKLLIRRNQVGSFWRNLRNFAKQASSAGEQVEKRKNAIKSILLSSTPPDVLASELNYEFLNAAYSGPGEYGYGARPNWLRGIARAKQLVEAIPSLAIGDIALEVACGDGMAAIALQSFGIQVQLTDLKDWRDSRSSCLPFVNIDLGDKSSLLPDGSFDLIYSYNAFEHFPDPHTVLSRMLMRLKPGGHMFFEFGPLYCGPWGLHAYRMLPMPYPQFLFSETFWKAKIKEKGVRDLGQELDDLQPLNCWTARQFDELWISSGCEVLKNEKYQVDSFLDLVVGYPTAFQGRGLTIEDLTIQGLCVLLRKPL